MGKDKNSKFRLAVKLSVPAAHAAVQSLWIIDGIWNEKQREDSFDIQL